MPGAGFRRGFKAAAERIALELRGELGLGAAEALDPGRLAEHLCVPVLTLDALRALAPREVAHFSGAGKTKFSAATIFVDATKRLIITNPAHAATRQMNSICHEVSHIVLEHEGELPLNIASGRSWDRVQEDEADWLAGCLLIPQDAAHLAGRQGLADEEVALTFGVSRALARWRMNSTGARIRATRLQRFR